MNERGFFTLIGICFLLLASILVIGLQETSRNYIIVADNFKNEADLKNIADRALIEAIEKIRNGEIELKEIEGETASRTERQDEIKISLTNNDDADVTVIYEYAKINDSGNIWFVNRSYASGKPFDSDFKKVNDNKYLREKGVVLISVASRKIDDDTTIYRRSMAYVKENEQGELDFKTIYFMNSLKDD